MKKLIFIRHGQTVYNAEGLLQGHSHSDFTMAAAGQAADAGAFILENFDCDKPTIFYSSELKRADRFRKMILNWIEQSDKDYFYLISNGVSNLLNEQKYGILEGHRIEKYMFPMPSPPDGEGLYEVAYRAGRLIRSLPETPFDQIVLVGHKLIFRFMIGMLKGFSFEQAMKHDIPNGAYNEVFTL